MDPRDDDRATGGQLGEARPTGSISAPTSNAVGAENRLDAAPASSVNGATGFKKWLGHLWSRDPDRQLELILALAIAFFALCQLVVTMMNNYGTSKQVDKIIATAGGIRDSANQMQRAAWDFKGSAQGIDGNLGNAVAQLEVQAKNIDMARQSTEKSAKASLQASIDTFHKDQRAWVGFTSLRTAPDSALNRVSIGVNFQHLSAQFINTGRTPALNVKVISGEYFVHEVYVPDGSDAGWMDKIVAATNAGQLNGIRIIVKQYEAPMRIWDDELLDPNMVPPRFKEHDGVNVPEVRQVGVMPPGIAIPYPRDESLSGGNGSTDVRWGVITYNDVYDPKITRVTQYCEYTHGVDSPYPFEACPVYNDMQ